MLLAIRLIHSAFLATLLLQAEKDTGRFVQASEAVVQGQRNPHTVRATKSHVATYQTWSDVRFPGAPAGANALENLPREEHASRLASFVLEVRLNHVTASVVRLIGLLNLKLPLVDSWCCRSLDVQCTGATS